MAKYLLRLKFVVVMLAVSISACGGKSPSAPGDPIAGPGPGGSPDQSRYESLPAVRDLVDDKGNPVVRLTLVRVNPDRGSKARFRTGGWVEFRYCLEAEVLYGAQVSQYGGRIRFSQDGITPQTASGGLGNLWIGTAVQSAPGAGDQVLKDSEGCDGRDSFSADGVAPKFILIETENLRIVGQELLWGRQKAPDVSFELDYQ